MVLFTLLGLYALFQRERKKGYNTHSGQHENVDQSDDLQPLERNDGQTSQDISSDPVVLPITEELTGDPQFIDDCSQDQSVEERIIDDPQVDDDWRKYLSLELPSIDNPQVDEEWNKYLKLELPIIDDPKHDEDWRVDVYSPPEDTVAPQSIQRQDIKGTIIDQTSQDISSDPVVFFTVEEHICQDQSVEERIIDEPQVDDNWRRYLSLELPSIDEPRVDDNWRRYLSLELPSIDEPRVDDNWRRYLSLELPSIDEPRVDDNWRRYLSLELSSIDEPRVDDNWRRYLSLELPSIDEPRVDDNWRRYLSLELPSIDEPRVDDNWRRYLSLELPSIDEPRVDDNWRRYLSLELPSIDEPRVDDNWRRYLSLELPSIDEPRVDDNWRRYLSLELPSIDEPRVDDNWRRYLSLELPSIDEPRVDDNWRRYLSLELPSIDEPRVDDNWRRYLSLELPSIDEPRVDDNWRRYLSLELPSIDEPRVDDNWRRYLSLELPSIDEPQVDDNWRNFLKLELPIIDDPKDDEDWRVDVYSPPEDTVAPQSIQHQDIKGSIIDQTSQDISSCPVVFFTVEEHICQDQSVEERIIDEPQVDDNWRRYLSLELPSIDEPQVDDNWRKFLKLELPIIDNPKVDKDWRVDVYSPPEDTVAPQSSQQQDTDGSIIEINSLCYKIGNQLGQGGFGTVFEATRLLDDVQVAVKFASKMEAKYIRVDGYCRPLPKEVMLHILASEPSVPQIIQLLDWQDQADQYIMVLERPMPCQSLDKFLRRNKSPIDEDLARVIMRQAALAAQICCQRGVFHRDIKLENLLINPDTLEVKLIDFGCGALLKSAGYTSYSGTREYRPLECIIDGRYHGEPATVWSLGIVLFVMLYRKFPRSSDLGKIFKEDIVTKNGFSQECCDFMCSCLQFDPKKRIKLENILLHDWLKENDRE